MSARLVVLTDANSGERRCINVAHVLTFKPSGNWTLITFANGDTSVVSESFADVVNSLRADRPDSTQHREAGIEMVEQVTIEHGLAFAEGWYEGNISEACDATEIMTWPGGGTESRELHARFNDLTDEICANVFALTKQVIAAAFVNAANDVLTRERER
jgi:hypothetical protein